jgi:hypothetical protein
VYLEKSDNLDLLFWAFANGTTVAVSDGSYISTTQEEAAAVWIVEESECHTQ